MITLEFSFTFHKLFSLLILEFSFRGPGCSLDSPFLSIYF